MARLGGYIIGPFAWWVWRGKYPVFVPTDELRRRVSGYLTESSLSLPPASIMRAYINGSTDVWLYVFSTAYDLIKHFRGSPVLRRRLGSLWCLYCPRCRRYLATSTTSEPSCEVCDSPADIVVFWTDNEARVFTVGPCKPYNGRLYAGGKGYFIGEILNVRRDLYGGLYATVMGYYGSPADTEPDRLVDVLEIPEIGWRRPVMLEAVEVEG
jgi:hypothetical protein